MNQPPEAFIRVPYEEIRAAEQERAWRKGGIPVGERHRQRLEKLAEELGIAVPWS